MSKNNEIIQNLNQFRGSEIVYKLTLLNTRYTEGIKYLAEAAACYWLITDVSAIAKSLIRRSYFITIDLVKFEAKPEDGPMAKIIYSDGNGNQFYAQEYGYTDFPLNKLRLFFVDNVLMLPSEY